MKPTPEHVKSRPAWPQGRPDCTLRLRGGIGAPAAARNAIKARLRECLGPERGEHALLLISELVTNAVRHGGASDGEDEVLIRLAFADGGYFEVCDAGPGFDAPDSPQARPEGGGMGLMLLNRMSRSWGVRFEDGACVWFELDC